MVLLIGGHARSGTTLLRHLCDGHRQMAITNELNFLSGLGRSYAEHSRILLARVARRTLNGVAFGEGLGPGLRGSRFAARYLPALWRTSGRVIDVAAVDRALRAVSPHASVVGDKTPNYVLLLDDLATSSGLSCLIIYRDCRDVVSSFLEIVRTKWRKRGWGRSAAHADRIAARWVRCIEAMERNRDHICVIRYEDLVTRPRVELGRLAEWLAIDPAGFDAERVASVRGTNIGKHVTGLTREELTTVMAIAGPAMARLGYT